MADRLLLESSPTDGYLLEDGSGVLLREEDTVPDRQPHLTDLRRRPTRRAQLNALLRR